jgi:hypothetical protein
MGSETVMREFHDALARSPETAVAVAAIKVTNGRIMSWALLDGICCNLCRITNARLAMALLLRH